ncbi:hypothetical protein [Algicola sagamiensis]|uniref:hypothetical protein n=1 Tax=Algicola sagamiensis TaxID=163869 RepID=UPI000369F781|nr:hypothetical protein [Algicola sagamiensis]
MFKKMMLKKTLFVAALFVSQSALATVTVFVENDSRTEDAVFFSKDSSISVFSPDPALVIPSEGKVQFQVNSTVSNVTVVDFEYGFEGGLEPKCHFRFTIIRDYRTGNMVPQRIIADDEDGSYRDKAVCSGRLKAFNLQTGEAIVNFSINRRTF